jgi:hypothetical protein
MIDYLLLRLGTYPQDGGTRPWFLLPCGSATLAQSTGPVINIIGVSPKRRTPQAHREPPKRNHSAFPEPPPGGDAVQRHGRQKSCSASPCSLTNHV